ncbi:MAG: AbrB/MazE/SpoVT family DNA-binding domain-containing protein [Candidatus Erginobacter occultus]|nr:AbrB/MazE/SpoVT family DNA-binding domain-containing protein [Candidatus Erginobacter occultus]
MVTATLTTKGQVTIPKEVRKSLGLNSGDRVAFVLHGDSEVTLKPINKSVDEVFGKLHDPARPSRTVEEMKEAVAERIRTSG